ncbi:MULTISPECIES: DUF3306 domain-containing protein [Shewanella]|uniref:DUF3306 domain-containing protein n=1 Tax=Shewanella TaxID=22 RepID=UPI0004DA0C93|nr:MULTISPECIES: DUF3306 domain-containing protein [Shewanella]KEK26757.1 hypothetical protein SXM_3706 [Shewanella xiamenensis]MDN5500938.1 DUF3306 domain-containing protein [Shewanella sp.]MDN5528967.1 DUF3306 domain-containing protein [Shewanella sp.]NMD51033.1 DUF3306 domain-containing protein [Shewanella sp. DNRA4]UML93542.1 DUF3306 domain-containing protein [Shewanella xiamenensis]
MTDSTPKANGFFSRWSQRREQVAAEEAAVKTQTTAEELVDNKAEEITQEPTAAQESQDALSQANEDPHRILTAEDLPNPDEIEIGGSFAQFMGANVDPAAKTAALRALWKQPHFNEIDGLLEYALDYSNQPKLTPEVSAELAQKVFRYITKDSEESEIEQTSTPDDVVIGAENTIESKNSDIETELATIPIADNLDGETDDLPQNAPEPLAQMQKPVV